MMISFCDGRRSDGKRKGFDDVMIPLCKLVWIVVARWYILL